MKVNGNEEGVGLAVVGSERPAIVDPEFAHLARYRWKLGLRGLVVREGDKVVKLHRVVVDAAPGVAVVHRDGDKLNNRRANLIYPCTASEARAHETLLRRTATRAGSREFDWGGSEDEE